MTIIIWVVVLDGILLDQGPICRDGKGQKTTCLSVNSAMELGRPLHDARDAQYMETITWHCPCQVLTSFKSEMSKSAGFKFSSFHEFLA